MQLFYTPDINPLEVYFLEQEESNHCVKVLRLKEGDELYLTDGIGNIYKAQILIANAKSCGVKVIETEYEYQKRNFYLHIAIAPTKNLSRIEWFVEKATEMGIDEISPMITEHSERVYMKTERLEKIIISAMKQSLKAYKPKLNPPREFSEIISSANQEKKLIGYCDNNETRYLIAEAYKKAEDVLILIGPEGDFSPSEIEIAKENGFKIINMGTSRLRTETAALFALCNIHSINL
jgi:16S rRNA (uracil1498-N3)-methyltransferase